MRGMSCARTEGCGLMTGGKMHDMHQRICAPGNCVCGANECYRIWKNERRTLTRQEQVRFDMRLLRATIAKVVG